MEQMESIITAGTPGEVKTLFGAIQAIQQILRKKNVIQLEQ